MEFVDPDRDFAVLECRLSHWSQAENAMTTQCESWKHFTSVRINRALNRKRRFWLQAAFDHLVRSAEQFEYLCGYIADSPKKAKLKTGEHVVYSRH